MADCHGIWASWIGIPANTDIDDLPQPPTDYWFNVEQEDNTGRFVGTHLKTFARLAGHCIMQPHRIIFTRVEPDAIYRYEGDITVIATSLLLVARGTRTLLEGKGNDLRMTGDDWIGVKTT